MVGKLSSCSVRQDRIAMRARVPKQWTLQARVVRMQRRSLLGASLNRSQQIRAPSVLYFFVEFIHLMRQPVLEGGRVIFLSEA
eukprot:scaffold3100_cov248-Pinguiococcus_pyrenoidosus.AAC.9